MPVADTDIKWFKSSIVADSASNGGRMSNTQSVSDVKNNIFRDVTQAERTAGVTLYRKMFVKNVNSADLAALLAKLFVENYTPGDGAVTIFPGTHTDQQSDVTGGERQYGCGQLDSDTGSTVMEIEVLVEDADLDIFQHGDMIRISDKDDINGSGNEEYAQIYGDVTYVGNVATIPLQADLQYSYQAVNTRVSSVYEHGTIEADITTAVVTSSAGTFSDGSFPIRGNNRGAIEQNWTLTFTSGTAFTVSGDTVGSVGSGNTSVDFAPTNPGQSQPYFTIESQAFGGTFTAGDTITFSTSPAAVPLWYRHTVPAGAASEPNDEVIVAIDFESA